MKVKTSRGSARLSTLDKLRYHPHLDLLEERNAPGNMLSITGDLGAVGMSQVGMPSAKKKVKLTSDDDAIVLSDALKNDLPAISILTATPPAEGGGSTTPATTTSAPPQQSISSDFAALMTSGSTASDTTSGNVLLSQFGAFVKPVANGTGSSGGSSNCIDCGPAALAIERATNSFMGIPAPKMAGAGVDQQKPCTDCGARGAMASQSFNALDTTTGDMIDGGLDARIPVRSATDMSVDQQNALNDLRATIPAVSVSTNTELGAPAFAWNTQGFLTGRSLDSVQNIVTKFLTDNRALYGLDLPDLQAMVNTKEYTDQFTAKTKINRLTHLTLQQTVDGIPVYEGSLNAAIMPDGRLVSVGSHLVPHLYDSVTTTKADRAISAAQAILNAAASVNLAPNGDLTLLSLTTGPAESMVFSSAGMSRDSIPVSLNYLPITRGETRLVYNVVLNMPNTSDWFEMTVDAQTGQVWTRKNWTAYDSYLVFPFPFRSPDDTPQKLVVNPADPIASPAAWHSIDGDTNPEFFDTRGNNVFAQEDRDGSDNGGNRPLGGVNENYNFKYNFTLNASSQFLPTTTQLFYGVNIYHDVLYHFGFTEAAGNFQQFNFGRGGRAADPVQADDQDNFNGGSLCNANMATPADGASPRVQMFICDINTPDRDTGVDAEVLYHELTHGLSTRMVGPGFSGGNPSQSGAMGEGWSDWYDLVLTAAKPSASAAMFARNSFTRGDGGYAFGASSNGPGSRREPYSPFTNIFTRTYADIDPQNGGSNEVHDAGEIWCNTLWDMYLRFTTAYGFDTNLYNGTASNAGNTRAMTLLTEAMTLTPLRPTFLNGRDAILAADRALYDGGNQCKIWTSFAKYGMGQFADDDGSDTRYHVQTDFTIPDGVCPDGQEGGGGDTGGGGGGNNDKNFEPNDFSDQAYNLGGLNRSIEIDGLAIAKKATQDRDWFKFQIPRSGPLNVNIEMDKGAGDLDLRIYTVQNGTLKELARSTKRKKGGTESVTINGKANTPYLIQIIGFNGATGGYNLQVNIP